MKAASPIDGNSRPSETRWRGYFAQRLVYPWERPSVMRKHIYTGVMGSVYFTLISGIFFVYYGNRLGMSRFQWGLMGGISSFLLTAQILSAQITQRTGRRKLLWFASALAGRGIRLLGILLGFCLWQAGWSHAGIALIVCICLSNFFDAMAAPPWLSWLADIIPEKEHGGFWGRRSAWISLFVICTVVPAGVLLDRVPESWKLYTTVAVFVAASLVGILDIVIHGTLPEPMMELQSRQSFLRQVRTPLADKGFRPWLIFNLCWTFSMTLGGSLSTLYFVEELGIKNSFLGGAIVLTSFTLIGSVLTAGWSGRLVDRVGPKRVLYWGHLLWAFLPGFWVFASPETALVWLGCGSLWGGTVTTAALTAANKLLTRFPPPAHRPMYVAISSCAGNLAGGLGVLTAGSVLKLLSDWSWSFQGATFAAFHVLFVASLCLRFASSALLIPRLRDPRREQPQPPA